MVRDLNKHFMIMSWLPYGFWYIIQPPQVPMIWASSPGTFWEGVYKNEMYNISNRIVLSVNNGPSIGTQKVYCRVQGRFYFRE